MISSSNNLSLNHVPFKEREKKKSTATNLTDKSCQQKQKKGKSKGVTPESHIDPRD